MAGSRHERRCAHRAGGRRHRWAHVPGGSARARAVDARLPRRARHRPARPGLGRPGPRCRPASHPRRPLRRGRHGQGNRLPRADARHHRGGPRLPRCARPREPLRRRLRLAQQARPEDVEAARRAHAASGVAAELAAFFDDVPARLARAQLVISRSGASTVAELAMIGRPAILVPYLYAADDHQTANARALEQAGGAWVMPHAAFTPDALAARLAQLMVAPETLARAAAAAHALGRPYTARALADLVIATIEGRNGDPATPAPRNAP